MAKVIPMDFIKGITGKVCQHSDSYFSMNSSSGKVYTGKRCNPYTGPATQNQLDQQAKFKARAEAATTWLNANKPSTANGTKGTELYQEAQSLKKSLGLSNIRQVVCLYMDSSNVIKLPSEGGSAKSSTTSDDGETPATTKYTVSLNASPAAGGTVTGAGSYTSGSTATISATSNSGYTFSGWSDGNTSASRSITVNADTSLTANFTQNEDGGGGGDDEENMEMP